MTPLALPALLAVALVVSAVLGPRLLRSATPAMVRTPRLAAALLGVAVATWALALLALGPVLAWVTAGPTLLPGATGEACQRCLAAANPLDGTPVATIVPTVALIALPALGVATIGTVAVRRALHRRRATVAVAADVARRGVAHAVSGQRVMVIADPRPVAFTLPRRAGGIVISEGTLATLDRTELDAVLAHETAHLHQRHHGIEVAVDALATPLRRVPLIAAAAAAIPHYLEIAADDAARRQTGTTALASALLKLSSSHDTEGTALPSAALALHAVGPDRIRHLVAPRRAPTTSTGATALVVAHLAALATASTAVHGPYLTAALTGCI